jgi:hypothetical protein
MGPDPPPIHAWQSHHQRSIESDDLQLMDDLYQVTTLPVRAVSAAACLAAALSGCAAPGEASPSPSGRVATSQPTVAPSPVATPSPSPVATQSPSPTAGILVHVIPALESAEVYTYVALEILKRGPGCEGKMVHPEIPDLFSDQVERAALAHSGEGLVSDHPPTYVGDVRAAAKAFGGFELFLPQPPDTRAWVVRLATAADEPVQAAPGTPMAVTMFRHDLSDGRTAGVLSGELVTLKC